MSYSERGGGGGGLRPLFIQLSDLSNPVPPFRPPSSVSFLSLVVHSRVFLFCFSLSVILNCSTIIHREYFTILCDDSVGKLA